MAPPEGKMVPQAAREDIDSYRGGDKDGRLLWQCIMPHCSYPRPFCRKDVFNKHLLEHPPQYRRQVYSNRKPARINVEKTVSTVRRVMEYFPKRWSLVKEKQLLSIRNEEVENAMKQLWTYSWRESPTHPGDLPTLLFALDTVGKDGLQPWDTLRHLEYIIWLHYYISYLLEGAGRRAFAQLLYNHIDRINNQLRGLESKSHIIAEQSEQNQKNERCRDALKEITDVGLPQIMEGRVQNLSESTEKQKETRRTLIEEAKHYMNVEREYHWYDNMS